MRHGLAGASVVPQGLASAGPRTGQLGACCRGSQHICHMLRVSCCAVATLVHFPGEVEWLPSRTLLRQCWLCTIAGATVSSATRGIWNHASQPCLSMCS